MIVWLKDIPQDEYVRVNDHNYYDLQTQKQIDRMFRKRKWSDITVVGYEAVPDWYSKKELILVRHFLLYGRDHFFGGAGLAPDRWWSDPERIPSEGLRVRDIVETPLEKINGAISPAYH